MNITNSSDLRARIAALETEQAAAEAAVATAQDAHLAALRSAITSPAAALLGMEQATEGALDAATATLHRTRDALTVARSMLREAEAAEALKARQRAAQEIESDLAQLARLGAQADEHFAAMIGAVQQMRAAEIRVRQRTNAAFGESPPGGLTAYTGFEGLRAFLGTLANGATSPEIKPWHSRSASAATKSVRYVTDKAAHQ